MQWFTSNCSSATTSYAHRAVVHSAYCRRGFVTCLCASMCVPSLLKTRQKSTFLVSWSNPNCLYFSKSTTCTFTFPCQAPPSFENLGDDWLLFLTSIQDNELLGVAISLITNLQIVLNFMIVTHQEYYKNNISKTYDTVSFYITCTTK